MNARARVRKRGRILVFGLMVAAGLGVVALAPPARAQILNPNGLDPCQTASADSTFFVPITFSSKTIPSDSGFYGYRSPNCNYWLVDVKMATYSNSYTPDGKNPMPLILSGGFVDLPSTVSGFPGYGINNQEDCQRYVEYRRFYKKLSTESAFTAIGSAVFKGQWSSSSGCNVYKASGTVSEISADPSSSGWDTYRVGVAVKLRTSWQEAGIFLNQLPPK